jgi:hypothetical protein
MWIWLRKQLGIDVDVRLSMNEYVGVRNELHALRQQVVWLQAWVKNLDTAVAHIERAATSGKTLTQEDVRKMAARIRSQISRSQVPLPSSIEEILQDERPKRTV